jgi:hypothetical protein
MIEIGDAVGRTFARFWLNEFIVCARIHAGSRIHALNTTGRTTRCMTTTITVRLSDKERKELAKHGRISEVVREALGLYLRQKNSRRIIRRLKELQKSPVRGGIQEDARLLRADRER